MKKSKKKQSEGSNNPSVHLEIIRHPNGGNTNQPKDGCGSTLFEPQRQQSNLTPNSSNDGSNGSNSTNPTIPAPEKKLTLFALRLAILEKAASGLGTLGFVWATVVLLGGFAVALKSKDFWVVTVILLVEGTRIFSRSHEIEWQHQSTTWSLTSAGRYSFRALVSSSRFLLRAIKAIFRPFSVIQSDNQDSRRITNDAKTSTPESHDQVDTNKRIWHSSDVPLLPYAGWVFISRNVSSVFYWLQLISASACAALSLWRLIQQDYSEDSGEDPDKKNLRPALNIFYGMALAEALMFSVEKAYWNWKIGYQKLLDKVCEECALGQSGMTSITRFFYDSYSRCIEGSIFDGLKMDLISFAEELLDSDSRDEQLIGARILHKFVMNDQFSSHTLRKIGTSTPVIERLIEILNWKNTMEEDIRRSTAYIVSKLAGKKQNAIRVAEIPGAIESVSSLLYTGRSYDARPHEIGQRFVVADRTDYEFSVFNLLGLLILKKLAHDHDNCWKIGNARGLVPKIVDFTTTSENLLRNDLVPESQIKIVKRSLKLVKILVRTTGKTGKMLRKEISDIVFTVSNIREILRYGESHMVLQKLGIEILTSLAMDEKAREKIGNTGGMIQLLLSILFMSRLTEDQNSVSLEAGEALTLLAFESRRNCNQIVMRQHALERLISLLNDPVLQVNSARILMNLCAYSGPECSTCLQEVIAAAPTVLKEIMTGKDKPLEVSIGLATQIFRITSLRAYTEELERAGYTDTAIANQLVQILGRYIYPDIKVPRIRRFLTELAIWMMKSQLKYVEIFKNLQANEAFKDVAETASELENFSFFSGSVGLGKDDTNISSLVDTALELME